MPEVILSDRAKRDLLRLAGRYVGAVEAAIDRLAADPLAGRALHGDLDGFRSLRIGSYRVVYLCGRGSKKVEIVWIRHRKEAYR